MSIHWQDEMEDALRQTLLAYAPLAELVGDRVVHAYATDVDGKTAPFPRVVFWAEGGRQSLNCPHLIMHVCSAAKEMDDAHRIMRRINEALHGSVSGCSTKCYPCWKQTPHVMRRLNDNCGYSFTARWKIG